MIPLGKWMDTIYTIVKAPISKPFHIDEGKKLLILANGPSASEFWDNEEIRAEFASYDLMCMNGAIFKKKEEISKLKPRFFILLDPVFLDNGRDETQAEREDDESLGKKTYEVLENINWKAYLIINTLEKISIKNENLVIIRLNRNTIWPKKSSYYKLYKKNLANPGVDTVLEGAIFWGITYGYKEIALLGTEFSLFKHIVVDETNTVYHYNSHFYENVSRDPNVKPVTKAEYGFEGSAVAYDLRRISNCFAMFFELNKYAEFCGCKIYNYTKESMIDAFERRRIKVEKNSDIDRKVD